MKGKHDHRWYYALLEYLLWIKTVMEHVFNCYKAIQKWIKYYMEFFSMY